MTTNPTQTLTPRALSFPPARPTLAVPPTKIADAAMGIADLDDDFWDFGLMLFALGEVSPWITWTDPTKYNQIVDRVQNLDITTIAACHSPVIEGPYIAKAFERIRQLCTLELP